MPTSFNDSLAIDRRLFRVEVRASIAHTDALFRAGILTRLEAERLKNGLWTMLKRAEHDRHYFDSLASTDLFSFIEARLAQLTSESAARLQTGRSREQRATVALRLWLREEAQTIDELLAHLQDALHDAAARGAENSAFSQYFVKFFRRDAERLNETVKNLNLMPVFAENLAGDEHLVELDFDEIARSLGFERIEQIVSEKFSDRDFCLDFAHDAVSIMMHLSRLAAEFLERSRHLPADNVRFFSVLSHKSGKIFGFYTALLSIFKDFAFGAPDETGQINEIVFEIADIVQSSLGTTVRVLHNLNSQASENLV